MAGGRRSLFAVAFADARLATGRKTGGRGRTRDVIGSLLRLAFLAARARERIPRVLHVCARRVTF